MHVCGSAHCCGHVINGTVAMVAFKEDKAFSYIDMYIATESLYNTVWWDGLRLKRRK